MKKRNILFAILTTLFVTVMIVACKKNNTTSSNPTMSAISIGSTGYSSGTLQVVKGSTVTWTNNDSVAHTVTSDNGAFDSGDIMKGGTYSYTFSSVGAFIYHDKHNASASGTVSVVNATGGGY
jgi:plastocyanin